ncbi:MAG TPA: hypothetical protein VKR55_16260 [Bradyrhizobium sp.]|uniref:hypothetical protein n=1 Tax=Bradyrhizobium sp. TaxID=376 RepID=UPI002CE179C8|nr:hypothetical protein [Bradyrhizobium sp.]HLZ03687.1 hypothetical protein [Bradyrhizobium sp.]
MDDDTLQFYRRNAEAYAGRAIAKQDATCTFSRAAGYWFSGKLLRGAELGEFFLFFNAKGRCG